jgi:mannose-6-phosphate isomerase-like protein (cupin superfamily)
MERSMAMKTERYQAGALILLAMWLFCTNIAHSQEPTNPAAAVLKSHIMLTPEEMKWGECSPILPAGAKCAVTEGDLRTANVLFGYRLKLPDNYRISPHFHPTDEHLVVISGIFNMGHGDKFDSGATRPMTPGSFVVMPKGAHHFAWTKGETIIQVYALGPWGLTYVNPKDDPRSR